MPENEYKEYFYKWCIERLYYCKVYIDSEYRANRGLREKQSVKFVNDPYIRIEQSKYDVVRDAFTFLKFGVHNTSFWKRDGY